MTIITEEMDYQFENLGDERFQEFCSALVSKEFPNIQAFPVGQPDGGRDSIVYQMNFPTKEFIVFQVKFVRNANQERDIHEWLRETIEKEVIKINKLIPKGATAYYLLTNVRGTAHLDSGSKDKVNKILEEKISIPSICWWRDDISTLFEKDPLFKWSFPEILNGQDILNSVLFQGINENKERRESVIKAYLVDQFEIDNEVKFKQIHLQNTLLNLFTDVPLRIRKFNEKDKVLRNTLGSFNHNRKIFAYDDHFFHEERASIGAAEFLLHPKVQIEIDRVLLEGGPGQGKSTISQYICQVHRARLLNKVIDIELIPAQLRNNPIRLPIKIDLRDVAAWVEKKNPYQGIISDEYFASGWKNSLEAFIIAHIFYHSKLEDFTSNDFLAVCKISPVLFVFDGFDEIANIKVRGEVIDFINKGITRISANVKSIQVLITSRPAAFTDSVGFSIENYPHFELTDITPPIISEYVEKWIKSSKIDNRDASELRKLIKEKLEMPHLKDLAKSPMQLAIFISLLRTKGQSLPNKRTALYDSYISLFFDRESEKNSLIRDKRDLIIDIHQYLAWVLHSEAELLKNSGSININDLNSRLKEYLSKEGHDTTIADQLFNVMKERVCALVSRVQGTFEFEVQPLREYFCAKYLYKSAPHSSAGSVKTGTKPDRLQAILRNYYWQNVVRFFAGCVDVGELDMLIQELKDLQNDEILKYTDYPRIITSQILSDYVFTQKPLKLKDVVKIIVDGINIGNIINQDGRHSSNQPLLLPNECGRKEVIAECFKELSKFPNHDFANELIGIINNNPLDNLEQWMHYAKDYNGEELTEWFSFGYRLQLIHRIDETNLYKIVTENPTQIRSRLQYVISGNRIDLINKNIDLKQIAFKDISNYDLWIIDRSNSEYSLYFLTIVFHPFIQSRIFDKDFANATFVNHLNRYVERTQSPNNSKDFSDFLVVDEIDKIIKTFSDQISQVYNIPLSTFVSSIEPWDIIVENARVTLGETWNTKVLATIAAGIKSKDDTFDDHEELHNVSLSLCKRVRCARMKSGNVKYWENHLNNTNNLVFTLLVFFTWATPKTIVQLFDIASKLLKSLNIEDYNKLAKYLTRTIHSSQFNKIQLKSIENELKDETDIDELKYILSLRTSDRPGYVYRNIQKYSGLTENANKQKFQYLLVSFMKDPSNSSLLPEIKSLYKEIQTYEEGRTLRQHQNEFLKMPYPVAIEIMKECKEYPRLISAAAEGVCRKYANENARLVGEVAREGKWFQDSL